MAWKATMAAKMAIISEGITQPDGTVLKKGFEYAAGLTLTKAAWPIYARERQGKVKPS